MRNLLLVCSLLQFCSTSFGNGISARTPPKLLCPSVCQCKVDSGLLFVDCSERRLTAVPPRFSSHTSILDLSTNNISKLQPKAFKSLHHLEELRLSGNQLRHIPGLAFDGLNSLRVLMLQNNQLECLPSAAVWDLPNLLSLRLDANLIPAVPDRTLLGLQSLRHLWLDDNALTEVPVHALAHLPSLQALTLAMNGITHIPSAAFHNLSSLVVLHLQNNKIQTLELSCFKGLHSLEILDMNHNALHEVPVAVKTLAKLRELGLHHNEIRAIPEEAFAGNTLLHTINIYENPIDYVGPSTFQYLPKLHTLSLNGAKEIKEFPNLTGSTSLETLCLAGTGLISFPQNLCVQLPGLKVLELSQNQIEVLPSFYQCAQLQEIYLNSNLLREIGARTFHQLYSLRLLDLSYNRISAIHQDAFASLRSLSKLDLTGNLLTSLPAGPLRGLTHLRLGGNLGLFGYLQEDDLPAIRVVEMPYAYQCCNFGTCNNNYFLESQYDHEELHQRTAAPFPKLYRNQNPELHEFLLEAEDKFQMEIYCTPIPGPFKPCRYLFDSWIVRVGIWAITLTSLVCNSLLVWMAVAPSRCLSPVKVLIASIAGVNLLTGLCTGTLALVDAWTFGEFSQHGAQWESAPLCGLISFISVFSSEASILFLGLATVLCSFTASHLRGYDQSYFTHIRAAIVFCVVLSLAIATLPVLKVGRYSISPLCLPIMLQEGQSSTLGFTAGLIIVNSLWFMLITGTTIKLLWDMNKCYSIHLTDVAMIKHLAWLVFSNVLIYSPIICLTFSSLTGRFHINSEVAKSIQLVLLHLPASLNPLFYILLSPHLMEDLHQLWNTPLSTQPRKLNLFHVRESMQTLVPIHDVDVIFDACHGIMPKPSNKATHPIVTVTPRLPSSPLPCP